MDAWRAEREREHRAPQKVSDRQLARRAQFNFDWRGDPPALAKLVTTRMEARTRADAYDVIAIKVDGSAGVGDGGG